MIAIDTNVLLRILVDDPTAPEQNTKARHLLAKADGVWVSMVVLIEAVWVLESAYRFVKPAIFSVLDTLVQYPGIVIEATERVNQAILTYSEGHTDFADCLILAGALEQHLTLHTFDRKLARLHGVKEVGPIVGQQ